MLFTVTKEIEFSASHQLSLPEPDHPCNRLHGHNYVVQATLVADALDGDMVLELGGLSRHLREILPDHQHLNDLFSNPTAEKLAAWIWCELSNRLGHIGRIVQMNIRVRETRSGAAEILAERWEYEAVRAIWSNDPGRG